MCKVSAISLYHLSGLAVSGPGLLQALRAVRTGPGVQGQPEGGVAFGAAHLQEPGSGSLGLALQPLWAQLCLALLSPMRIPTLEP